MRRIVTEKRLGTLQGASASLYMGKNRRLLDVLWHDGTHIIDALAFLCGGVPVHQKRTGASLQSRSGTAFLSGVIRQDRQPHTGNIPFMLELGAGRDHLLFEITLSFDAGRLRIGNGIYEVWESTESPYAEGFRSLSALPDTFAGDTRYFANMVSDAVACVRDPSRAPLSSATDAHLVITYLTHVHRW
jgi:predicted dehydrogenase